MPKTSPVLTEREFKYFHIDTHPRSDGKFYALMSTSPFYVQFVENQLNDSGPQYKLFCVDTKNGVKASFVHLTYTSGDTSWKEAVWFDNVSKNYSPYSVFPDSLTNPAQWANHEILTEDGSVFVSASLPINAETGEEIHDYELSEPIPVEPIDPQSYLMGFRVGQLLKGMR